MAATGGEGRESGVQLLTPCSGRASCALGEAGAAQGARLAVASIPPIPAPGGPPASAPGRRGRFREEQPDPATTWARAPSPRRAQPREGHGRLLRNENSPLGPRRTRASGQNSGLSLLLRALQQPRRPGRERRHPSTSPHLLEPWGGWGRGQRPPSGRLSLGPQAESVLPGPPQSARPPTAWEAHPEWPAPRGNFYWKVASRSSLTWAQDHRLPL